MAPLVNNDLAIAQSGDASNGNEESLFAIAAFAITAVFVVFSTVLVLLFACACCEKKKEEPQEKAKEEFVVPPPTSQTGASAKGPEPIGGSKKGPSPIPSGKSGREPQTKKINLTPPGATCPPQYMPEDEDKTVNVEGLLKKGPA